MIGYSTEPNYHECCKLEQDLCAELCSLAGSSVQGHSLDQARQG